MDKNLEDMEKLFDDIDFDFSIEELDDEETEEMRNAMKELLIEIEKEEKNSDKS